MQNGHAKTNGTNGHASYLPVPAEAAQAEDAFAFLDDFNSKVKEAVKVTATKEAHKLVAKVGAQRYLDGLRRGAHLVAISLNGLDGPAREKVLNALGQLENEVHGAEKAITT